MSSQRSTDNAVSADQQQLLVKALTSIANAVFITDEIGQIVWMNDAFSYYILRVQFP